MRLTLSIFVLACPATMLPASDPPQAILGNWAAWLDSPGGKLVFELEIGQKHDGDPVTAHLRNGPERMEVPRVAWSDQTLVLEMPHYDSVIQARLSATGQLTGTWQKRRGPDQTANMRFQAERGSVDEGGDPAEFLGRWRVEFSSSTDPAVAIIQQTNEGLLWGTFLTTTGDYRYLSGQIDDGQLRLCCFDGAHAFLFRARQHNDRGLVGDFWSGNWWHETWKAVKDSDAQLPDPLGQSTWKEDTRLDQLVFSDLDGTRRSLADPEFHGNVRIIELFGSWCPNCHDAAEYLSELHERYHKHGLSIVGLAFELTGDFERDARQVREYIARHDIRFPILLAGLADKSAATAQFGALDRIRAYPTIIFLDARGRVAAVHSGFSGPATGSAHEDLRRDFESRIERMLAP